MFDVISLLRYNLYSFDWTLQSWSSHLYLEQPEFNLNYPGTLSSSCQR
jgi:hypothetical protein